MLTEDELNDLAADIKQRGQLHPIVLDDQGRILDGRNRHAACLIAGVEPRFETYSGDDPDGYALSVNIARRHLTKGQQAMIIASAGNSVSTGSVRKLAQSISMSHTFVNRANAVIEFAPDLVDSVVSGTTPLNDAYKVAQQRKAAATSDEARMARLQAEDPDLASLVREERISLDTAIRQLEDNNRRHRDHVQLVSTGIYDVVQYCASLLSQDNRRKEYAGIYDHSVLTSPLIGMTAKDVSDAGKALVALAKEWKR
jgi:hypothetical protein